jgi:hypothetical protein
MRTFALVLLFALPACAFAGVNTVLSADGKLDPAKLELFVAWVEPSIRQYPPRFKDKEHQDQVVGATQGVVKELLATDTSQVKDQKTVTNVAHTFAMAHNIDLGTAKQAHATFEKAISLNPEDRRTNYLFGMFLIATKAHHFDGLPYLEKALALGERDALFSIGLLLVEKGENEKGLVALETYAKEHPEDTHTRKIIQAIKDGKLKFKSSDG